MPPALLFDPSSIDQGRLVATRAQIYEVLPHRHDFMQLDAVTMLDEQRGVAVAYRDVRMSEFWVKGHIPGRPIFPGVLMIEAVAQLASFATSRLSGADTFLGLGGVDKVKFRGTVIPDCRMIILTKLLQARSRRWVWACQALVEDRLVFEGEITGMPV